MREGGFRLFPAVKEVLEQPHEQDVLLGLISNAPEMAIMETVEYYGLKKYFKFYRGIEDFDDLSDRKPHPDHLDVERAEMKREPLLYVGDHESDIRAAKNAEMASAWVNRNDSSIEVVPDYEVQNLRQLVERIK
jgi:HAD superfamily hydrolase (TIGR01549 family)